MTRLLELFNRWFVSLSGVYQTLAVTAAVVVFEWLYPNADPNHFWVLYVLTVYSGVTQNILGYGNHKTGERTDLILDRLEHIVSDECIVDRRTYDLVAHIAKQLEARNDLHP